MSSEANFELYIITLKGDAKSRYSKELTLEEIISWLEVRRYGKPYEEYIRPAKLYFTEDFNELATALNVRKIVPKGLYIMGVYGGEKKKGEEEYAGLILENYVFKGSLFEFKLQNVGKVIDVPQSLLKSHGVKVYEAIYVSEINPFKLRRTLPILLSERGEKALKQFLNSVVRIHNRNLSNEDVKKLLNLVKEVEQPSKVETLNINNWYVIYRCERAFTAFAFKPDKENVIAESHVSYLETSGEDIAYYYAAVLNYLAYCVMRERRSFMRSQFARPLSATYIAGLSWGDVDESTRRRVVELSKVLHQKVPSKEYSNQRVALKDVSEIPEFKELTNVLDNVVDKDRFEEALNLVSGGGEEEAD